MAFSITLTGNALLGHRFLISDSNLAGDFIKVTREDQSGHYDSVSVRSLDLVATSSSPIIVIDYEAPLNTELKYIWEVFDATDLNNSVLDGEFGPMETNVPLGFVVLTEVVNPANVVSGAVLELHEWANPGRVRGTHYVLGRRNPVVVTDVQSGRTGTLVMSNLTISDVAYDDVTPYEPYSANTGAWDRIFVPGETLLFRNDWSASGFDDCYLQVTGVSSIRLSRILGTEPVPILRYEISYIEVDRPRTDLDALDSGENWQAVLSGNTDWAEVLSDHPSWLDVLGNPSA